MGLNLYIDPGTCSGYAYFEKAVLIACGIFTSDGVRPSATGVEFVVIERPQVYPQNPVPANDLVTLSILVGRLTEFYSSPVCKVEHVLPRAWKGQLPKEVCWARAAAKLSMAETLIVEQAKLPRSSVHNMRDAVALGIWHSDR